MIVMHHYIELIIRIAGEHQYIAYGMVYLMAMAEALPVAGAVVPGSAVIVAMGALVPTGALGLWPLIGMSILGAVSGDGASYWLGRHYQREIAQRWPLSWYPQLLGKGEDLFRRHGGKSVFLARFVQGPRAFVPLAAGMMGMAPRRFYAFNIASALLWAPAHVLGGALLGASLELLGAIAGRLAVFLVLLVVTLWAAAWLARRIVFRWGLPALGAAQGRAVSWAAAKDTWVRRQIVSLIDPARPESRALLMGVLLLIGSLWLFFGILEDVLTGDPLVRADSAVYHFLQGLRTAWGDRLMVVVTELGDAVMTSAVAVAVLAWLLLRRAWRTAGYWVGAVGVAALFTTVLKLLMHAPRPTAGLYGGWDAFSFPSGHATVNAALYGFLAFLLARELHPRWRAALVAVATLLVTAIAFSRLYLGAHWVADVAAGLAVSTAWVALLAIGYVRRRSKDIGARGLLAVVALTVAIVGPFHITRQYSTDVARYARQPQTRTITLAEWQAGEWRQLPARRVDLGGEWEEPITLQWAGGLEDLKRRLLAAGWREPVPWSVTNTLSWLKGAPPLELPVLPKLEDGRPPALELVHAPAEDGHSDERAVLQVWASSVVVRDARSVDRAPLWLGTVVQQRLGRVLGLITLARAQPAVAGARTVLARAFPQSRVVYRTVGTDSTWDGGVLLVHDAQAGRQTGVGAERFGLAR